MRLKLFLSCLLLTVFLSGCSNRYKVTLSNGNVMTTTSKPKLDKASGAYHFKDSEGRPGRLPSFRVCEIEPL